MIQSIFNLGKQERCKHRHTREEHPQCFDLETKSGSRVPKVLIFDIETLPMRVFVWNLGKQRISPTNVISDYYLVSWSAKWLFSSEIMSDVLTPKEAKNMSDKRISESIWRLFDEADVVIAHNGNRFDIPKLNTRFIINGMNPPSAYKSIDTCSAARTTFGFSSNSLDYLSQCLGLPTSKIKTNYSLWTRCIDGDADALKEMETYNKEDVVVLEDAYVKLRPWIKSHPNMALYIEVAEPVCSICTSKKLEWGGEYTTSQAVYKAFRCKGCGAIGRGNTNILTKARKQALTKG